MRSAQHDSAFSTEKYLFPPVRSITAIECAVWHDLLVPRYRDPRSYCIYILGSPSGTLYVGFTGNLHKRIFEHKFRPLAGFASKHSVDRLLYWESFDDVHKAIRREKQLKGWRREKKIALIASRNPHWLDLARGWYPWMTQEIAA